MENKVKKENWVDYSLNVPTLAVYANSPELPDDNAEYLKTLFPNLDYHLWENTDHFLMLERPKEFNMLLENFLKKTIHNDKRLDDN